jgi:tripartite-type tricarboxylate transporter receptor subunit TctC
MSRVTRRAIAVGAPAVFFVSCLSRAQAWPDRPITLMHGFAPGGGADITARLLANPLAERLGQPVIVESKPGAGSTIASAEVARAAHDGGTLLMAGSAFAASAAMYKDLPYRPVEDFTPIDKICRFPFLIVTYAEHPMRSIGDLVREAKTRSKPMLYGTNGQGSTQHLAIELLAHMANVRLQHVPFRGGAEALNEVLGKRIDFMLDPPAILIEHIKDGSLRALATTSIDRFPDLPDVPTVAESGFPDFDVSSWFGVLGPADLPAKILQRLDGELKATVAQAEVQGHLRALGMIVAVSSPETFTTQLTAEIAKWRSVVAEAGIAQI